MIPDCQPPIVTVCAWCDASKTQTAILTAAGYVVTHGICDKCEAKFREESEEAIRVFNLAKGTHLRRAA